MKDQPVNNMKNIKLVFLFYILLYSVTDAKSQTKDKPKFKWSTSIESYIHHHLATDFSLLESTCGRFMISVKFVVDANGIVVNIEPSIDTPDELDLTLTTLLRGTSKNWEPVQSEGRPVSSTPMIMPIEININGGCDIDSEQKFVDNFIKSKDSMFIYGKGLKPFDTNNAILLPRIKVELLYEKEW